MKLFVGCVDGAFHLLCLRRQTVLKYKPVRGEVRD